MTKKPLEARAFIHFQLFCFSENISFIVSRENIIHSLRFKVNKGQLDVKERDIKLQSIDKKNLLMARAMRELGENNEIA